MIPVRGVCVFKPTDNFMSRQENPRAPLVDTTRLPALKVILADDNPVNQRLLSCQLEYLGLQAVVSSDGMEAVASVKNGDGVLVLMDCQMPEMDGFDAARAIREWEQGEGRPPIPIIAVTANATGGDAERCLAAGMSAYLSKPVEFDKLHEMLARWLPALPEEELKETSGHAVESPGSREVIPNKEDVDCSLINESQLHACLTGDPATDAELVHLAMHECHEMLERLGNACRDGADAAWRLAAHRGRGSCGTMGFVKLAELLHEAEFDELSREARSLLLTRLHQAHLDTEKALQTLGHATSVIEKVQ
jgi:CheY-like chemotaxis protein/HPt (histidine-containing phosphotransfer) domain-containing protein